MAKTYGKLTLSLTGKDSHKVNITPGQGSFSIAPKTFGEKADAYVDAELFLFDVSPNLSMSLAPSLIAQPWSSTSPSPTVAPGLSYRLLF